MNLTLPYIPDGRLAENRRRGLHWGSYASLLARERERAWVYLLEALGPERPHFERVTLMVQFQFGSHYGGRLPDHESVMARCKPLLDMVVRAGILSDDGPRVIVSYTILASVRGKQDETRLLLEEQLNENAKD